jgi:hypothetical protein
MTARGFVGAPNGQAGCSLPQSFGNESPKRKQEESLVYFDIRNLT